MQMCLQSGIMYCILLYQSEESEKVKIPIICKVILPCSVITDLFMWIPLWDKTNLPAPYLKIPNGIMCPLAAGDYRKHNTKYGEATNEAGDSVPDC